MPIPSRAELVVGEEDLRRTISREREAREKRERRKHALSFIVTYASTVGDWVGPTRLCGMRAVPEDVNFAVPAV